MKTYPCDDNIGNRLDFMTKFVLILFVFVPFVYLLASFSKYYFMGNMNVYSTLLLMLSSFFAGGKIRDRISRNYAIKYLLASTLLLIIPVFIHQETPFVIMVCELVYAFLYLSLSPFYKRYVYDKFIRILAPILFLGIIEYVMSFFGVSFFWATIERASMSGNQTGVFYQGFFVIVPAAYSEITYRFMSLCEEPGMLGTLCFFVVVSMDREKYKKEFWIYLISGMLSLSLAFYILLFIWLIIEWGRLINFRAILLSVALFSIFIYVFGSFFESRIVDRITDVNSISDIDNRSSSELRRRYDTAVLTGEIFLGMGNRSYYEWETQRQAAGAGLKKYLLQYGLLGFALLFIVYSYFYIKYNGFNRKHLVILLLFWLSFYQRAYWNNVPLTVVLFAYSSLGVLVTNRFKIEKIMEQHKVGNSQSS